MGAHIKHITRKSVRPPIKLPCPLHEAIKNWSSSSHDISPSTSPKTRSPIHDISHKSLDLKQKLTDSLELENSYHTNSNRRKFYPHFQA